MSCLLDDWSELTCEGLKHDEVDELGGQGVEEEAFEDHEQQEPDQHEQPSVQQEQVAVPLPSDEPAEEGEGDFNGWLLDASCCSSLIM